MEGNTPTPALENNATPPTPDPAPATGNVVDQAEVERLKLEASQARMRAAQLEKEKAERITADEEARKKQLEEQAQWKTIAEEAQAKASALEAEKANNERQAQLTAASQDVLKEYPETVQKIAQTAGLSLLDDSDAAKSDFKAKLDSLQQEVGGTAPTVKPNNPPSPANPTPGTSIDASTPEARANLTARMAPGEPSPMALAAAKGDSSVVRAYVSNLPGVQRMREIANGQ